MEQPETLDKHNSLLRSQLVFTFDQYVRQENKDFASFKSEVQTFHDTVLALIAERVTSNLNDHIRQCEQGTAEHQFHLRNEINLLLKNLNLSILCPNTGLPTLLDTAPRDGKPRFCLKMGSARTKYWQILPDITLIPAPPRRANRIEHGGSSNNRHR